MTICDLYKVNIDPIRHVEIYDRSKDMLLYEGKIDLVPVELLKKEIIELEPMISLRLYKVTYTIQV